MKGLIKASLNTFVRQKAFLMSYAALLAGALIFAGMSFSIGFSKFSSVSEFSYSMRAVQYYIIILTYFLFISYEYFLQTKRCGLEECAKSTGSIMKLYASRFTAMLILGAIIAAVLVVEVIGMLLFLGSRDYPVLLNILSAVILNSFGAAAAGTAVGFIFSAVSGRIGSYICFILFVFFSSPVTNMIRRILDEFLSFELTYFWRLFPLSPDVDSADNPAFGFSVLEYRYCAVLFWVVLAAVVGCLRYLNLKISLSKVKAVSTSVLCAVLAAVVLFPASALTMSSSLTDGVFCDHYYYKENEQLSETADFHITEMKLTLNIGLRLTGEAELHFDNAQLNEYKLTLHRFFKVSGVYGEDGGKLEYTRNGDYLCIQSGQGLESAVIRYKGCHPRYYTNSQGAVLPGYFPFYPMDGYRRIYSVDLDGYLKNQLSSPAKLSLTVTGLKKVYTNLTEVSSGVFEGTASAITVVSGLYTEAEICGAVVAYPSAERNMRSSENVTAAVSELIAEVKSREGEDVRKIIVLPRLNDQTPYAALSCYGECVTVTSSVLGGAESYLRQLMPEEKLNLFDYVYYYKRKPESLDQMCSFDDMLLGQKPEHYPEAKKLRELIEVKGAETALSHVESYLFNESDTRTVREFFESEGL